MQSHIAVEVLLGPEAAQEVLGHVVLELEADVDHDVVDAVSMNGSFLTVEES